MNPIAIIMPVRNRPKLTKQTVDTLFKNTTLPFKLIIVNDNSDDETNKYLETLGDKARVISMPESKGSGPCKNAGIAVAGNPDFYYFTDNDIYRNGSVGIGTVSPAKKLTVSDSDAAIKIQDSDGASNSVIMDIYGPTWSTLYLIKSILHF